MCTSTDSYIKQELAVDDVYDAARSSPDLYESKDDGKTRCRPRNYRNTDTISIFLVVELNMVDMNGCESNVFRPGCRIVAGGIRYFRCIG